MSEHHHHHDDHDHGHGHGHDHSLQVIEEPLDPANQSLADALRLSFWVLKGIMIVLIVLFLFSGVFMVDQKQVVLVSRFGKLVGEPRNPGLNFAWPPPIDERIEVSTSPQTLTMKAFWLNLSESDQRRSLSEIPARGTALEPGVDGVLVTGDRRLMHLLLNVEYQVNNKVRLRADRSDPAEQLSDAVLFVDNVDDAPQLVRTVIQNATLAEAARASAEAILRYPEEITLAIRKRSQQVLDDMETGIVLVKVVPEKSYFPLQARDEYLNVDQAANMKQQAINAAESDRTKKLLGAAGEAWEAIRNEIERLDQVADEKERAAVIAGIENLLITRAEGDAGGRIQMARKDKERILEETMAEVARFNAVLEEYRRSPDLVRRRMQSRMLNDLYADQDVIKWWMPAGDKQLMLLLNKDPEEIRQAEREMMKKKVGAQ